jgi:hypothetical protein
MAKPIAIVPVPRELLSESDVDAILEIAERRAALVGEMRDALEAGDEPRALRLARKVCGIEHEAA